MARCEILAKMYAKTKELGLVEGYAGALLFMMSFFFLAQAFQMFRLAGVLRVEEVDFHVEMIMSWTRCCHLV